jgi:molybdate transport system substrate-binding protein
MVRFPQIRRPDTEYDMPTHRRIEKRAPSLLRFSRFRAVTRISALVIVAALVVPLAAAAQEVRAMVSGAFTEAYQQAVPEFERTTRYKVVSVFGASMGGAPDSIPSRLQRGEAADLVIMAAAAVDDLIRQGRVVPGSRIDLVRSGIGIAVRAGARKPDISTVDALRRTLLEAKSIAYSASASGVYLSTELFPRLGIAEQIAGKSRRIESERVGAVVARGDAEIGFQQISELLPIAGIELVGPLPAGAQRVTIFSAGLATGAKEAAAARQLIAFLQSPAVAAVIAKTGLEPVVEAARGVR